MLVMLLSHSGFVCSPPKSIAIIIKPQIFSCAMMLDARCYASQMLVAFIRHRNCLSDILIFDKVILEKEVVPYFQL